MKSRQPRDCKQFQHSRSGYIVAGTHRAEDEQKEVLSMVVQAESSRKSGELRPQNGGMMSSL